MPVSGLFGSGLPAASDIAAHARPKVRLRGGGGAALILPTARRVALWRSCHDRRAFVERLDFVTGAGSVTGVVTPLAIPLRAPVPGERLNVAPLLPRATAAMVAANTGFAPGDFGAAPVEALPTPDELEALARLDPERVREREFA